MSRIILLNKPFGVLSQFSGDDPESTLAAFIKHKHFYPAGRLDKDSEGLLVLTDDGKLQQRIAEPRFKKKKVYLAQVDGEISDEAIGALCTGVQLKDGKTRPAAARRITEPDIWERNPPVRFRKNIPTSWIEITLQEGRNRQVRRMTAAVGFPTLRLVRSAVAEWELGELQPGQWQMLEL